MKRLARLLRSLPLLLAALLLSVGVAGCSWAAAGGDHIRGANEQSVEGQSANKTAEGATAADRRTNTAGAGLRIVATTSYLADAARHLAPGAEITTLVGPGGDPHTYQASTRGIQRLLDADLVLWNGLGLEAQLDRQLRSLGKRGLAVGETLPESRLLPLPAEEGGGAADDAHHLYDPHVWNDPQLWQQAVTAVAEGLGGIDPAGREHYLANARSYNREIARAAAKAARLLAQVGGPRILITGHDAFSYFGRSFDLEVHATDFISTQAKLGLGELAQLASLISGARVPTIFLDNQVNPQAIESLSEAVHTSGWRVRVSGSKLYADSLGASGVVSTYTGALLHNARAIAKGLANAGNGE